MEINLEERFFVMCAGDDSKGILSECVSRPSVMYAPDDSESIIHLCLCVRARMYFCACACLTMSVCVTFFLLRHPESISRWVARG